jgi:hypothetical protein
MPHPLADGREVNARFEQCYCGSVAERMRMDMLFTESGGSPAGDSEILAEQVSDPKPRELLPPSVGEQECIGRILFWQTLSLNEAM